MAKKDKDIGFNINSFVNGSNESKSLAIKQPVDATVVDAPKKKNTKKDTEPQAAPSYPIAQSSMSYIQDNIPYQMAYAETNAQLDEAIQQLNMLGGEMMADLQMVRSSKTLKNKFNIVNDMTENAVSIINAKISAIKEKNNTINGINNLEIRRIKELKLQNSEEDDNVKIANMYHAFVNTPIGAGPGVLAPPMQTMMMPQDNAAMPRVGIGGDETEMWQQGLDPARNRMLLEAQGNLEIAVMYDESTGNRWYIARNPRTGEQLQNVELPDASTIYELDLSVRNGWARDSNRNTTYPLIVVNGNNSIMEY